MDDVDCTGSEAVITDCQHVDHNSEDCEGNEAAGVICSPPSAETKTTDGVCKPVHVVHEAIKGISEHFLPRNVLLASIKVFCTRCNLVSHDLSLSFFSLLAS